jgi:hypothetical protein
MENKKGIRTDTAICKVMAVLTFTYENYIGVVRRHL